MNVKPIKTEEEYDAAMAVLDQLMDAAPSPGSEMAAQLEALAFFIDHFEKQHFPIDTPDPIEALLFRMEQGNISRKQLAQYLGSPSRVSEVLSRKRPLTLKMRQLLHKHLGIPAKVLLADAANEHTPGVDVEDWQEYPLKEMAKRGYFSGAPQYQPDIPAAQLNQLGEGFMRWFVEPFASTSTRDVMALHRKTITARTVKQVDNHALEAWKYQVLRKALQVTPKGQFDFASLKSSGDFLTSVAQLSWSDQGPRLAQEFLSRHGITLITEPHLPHTYLDAAALALSTERPVIGLTLRYDRIDNFWFCLMHELAHLFLHFQDEENHFVVRQYFDDLDSRTPNQLESEADSLALESLIPTKVWELSSARVIPSTNNVKSLAAQLRIHPAIVVGRLRHERKVFSKMPELVGQGQIRKHFPDVTW